ncbi:MAG: hypothetical protein QM754_10980 [Tepidisphaeraceae bacterium]
MSKVLRMCALGVIASVLLGNAFACNTVEGMGKDGENLSEKVQDAADRNK